MRKSTKIWLIVAIVLIITGAGIFTGFMAANDWDFSQLSTVVYETNEYRHFGKIKNIVIETTTADISIECSVISTQYAYVECYEDVNATHTVTFEDGTLTIKEVDNRKWYDHIGINFDQPKITIGLTALYYDQVTIRTVTGDVEANMLWGKDIDISVTTGDVELKNMHCDNLTTTGSTGDVELTNVRAVENLTINRSTGDVEFEDCDGENIVVSVTTGDVEGNLLTGKIFKVKTRTGDVEVPKNSIGGTCTITTTTGDIEITTR